MKKTIAWILFSLGWILWAIALQWNIPGLVIIGMGCLIGTVPLIDL